MPSDRWTKKIKAIVRSDLLLSLFFHIFLFSYLFSASLSSATLIVPVSDRDLIEQSTAIVVGEVTAIQSHWDPQKSQIFTHITLSLHDVLKGELPVQELTIEEIGGSVANLHSWVYGNPEFIHGEKVLLFLRRRADGTMHVVQLYQMIVRDIVFLRYPETNI